MLPSPEASDPCGSHYLEKAQCEGPRLQQTVSPKRATQKPRRSGPRQIAAELLLLALPILTRCFANQSPPSARPTFPPLPPAAPPLLSSRDRSSAPPAPTRPAPPLASPYPLRAVSADQSPLRRAPARHTPSPFSRHRRARKYPLACRSGGSGTYSCFPPLRALPRLPGGTSQSPCARLPAPPLTASSPPPLP